MTASLPEGLQQAASHIKAGQLQLAQPLLVQYIKQQPDSADAWYLMSFVVADQRQQIDCLQRVLRFNPAHRQAQARLVEVMTASASPAASSAEMAAPSSTPTITPARRDEAAPTAMPQPQPTPAPIKPEPKPTLPEPSEFNELRSQLAEPLKKRRGPRILLFLLILIGLAALGGAAVVMFNLLRERAAAANSAAATQAALTPTLTATPTVTPTPTRTPRRFPPTWTPTGLPTALPTRTPTPPPTPDAPQDAQLRSVQQAVAALRGLPAADLPKRYIIQPDQVENISRNILNSGGVLSVLPDRARVLSALGLVKPTYNLERYMLNLYLDPAGGFYSPWTREVFVVANQKAGIQSWAFALEAARASLDQSFELARTGAYPVCALNTQQCQAVRALIAGDAALAAQQWLRQSASAQTRSEAQSFKPPALLLADDLAPLFVTRDVSFAAGAGATFAQYLFQRGGWERLNKIQTDLPQSTEQIMHPEKYFDGEQPIELAAVPLTTTLDPAWQLIADDVLGEWHTYLLLSANADESLRVSDEAARSAARGWGGDRLQSYYNNATYETLLAVAWTWDTTADAREFKQALSAHLDLRFGSATPREPQANGDCWQASQQAACLYTRDKNTLWLLAPDRSLIDAITAAYAPFP